MGLDALLALQLAQINDTVGPQLKATPSNREAIKR